MLIIYHYFADETFICLAIRFEVDYLQSLLPLGWPTIEVSLPINPEKSNRIESNGKSAFEKIVFRNFRLRIT